MHGQQNIKKEACESCCLLETHCHTFVYCVQTFQSNLLWLLIPEDGKQNNTRRENPKSHLPSLCPCPSPRLRPLSCNVPLWQHCVPLSCNVPLWQHCVPLFCLSISVRDSYGHAKFTVWRNWFLFKRVNWWLAKMTKWHFKTWQFNCCHIATKLHIFNDIWTALKWIMILHE